MEKLQEERYSAATIPAFTLAGLIDYAATAGHDPDRWFDGSGLNPKQVFDPDARLSFRQIARILKRALRAVGEDGQVQGQIQGIGLAIGSRATLSTFGVLGFSMLSSPTMADVAAVGQKFHPVSGSLMDASCRLVDGEVVLEAIERFPEPELLPFLCEKFFASALAATRALLGDDYCPLRLDLSYPAPSYAQQYRQLFGCPVRFEAGRNCMLSDPELLAQPLRSASPSSHAEAVRLCEARMDREAAPDHIAALRQWLREHLQDAPTIAAAASALHLHERTLRRRLQEAGTSFRELYDRQRADWAREQLRDPKVAIADVAAGLGFSDEREFRRAYKRWTGMPPSSARAG